MGLESKRSGDVRERTNRHAWNACVGQLTVGSNPTVSANGMSPDIGTPEPPRFGGCRVRARARAGGDER